MANLVWITDPHLDSLAEGLPEAFGASVREGHPNLDAVVVTGDIGTFTSYERLIENFAKGVGAPVWFVLGNHDCYDGSIALARKHAAEMTGQAKWLVTARVVPLTATTALVGEDGWYDAQNGDAKRSNVLLNDFFHIREFLTEERTVVAKRIADLFAMEAKELLEEAVAKGFKKIVFATHVPPYPQASWHQGSASNDHWLPWMSSKAMGTVLDEVSGANPDVDFTVLCGHTHSPGHYMRDSNLRVLTGHSDYGAPRISGSFIFD